MDKEPWTVLVVAQFGIAIHNFTAGVLDSEEELGFTYPVGFSGVLSLAAGKDLDSINKYAAIYKHCDQILATQSTDSVSWQNVKNAKAEPDNYDLNIRLGAGSGAMLVGLDMDDQCERPSVC